MTPGPLQINVSPARALQPFKWVTIARQPSITKTQNLKALSYWFHYAVGKKILRVNLYYNNIFYNEKKIIWGFTYNQTLRSILSIPKLRYCRLAFFNQEFVEGFSKWKRDYREIKKINKFITSFYYVLIFPIIFFYP